MTAFLRNITRKELRSLEISSLGLDRFDIRKYAGYVFELRDEKAHGYCVFGHGFRTMSSSFMDENCILGE